MVTRFLDWLDESAAGVIRVAYLLAGVIAVASYFADGATHIPLWIVAFLTAALPWVLAGALEIHTYLTARRVRRAWQDRTAATDGSHEREQADTHLKVNLAILVGLLAFSMYNQLQYLAQTWTPPTTPLTPPGFWPYVIRATITPAAFMAAAFLAPVGEGMAARVQQEASYLSMAAFKAAARQWKRRLREMSSTGQDITAALVHLVDEPRERRVIETIWQAMHQGETLPGANGGPPLALPAPTPASVIVPSVAAILAPPHASERSDDSEPPTPPAGGPPSGPKPPRKRQEPGGLRLVSERSTTPVTTTTKRRDAGRVSEDARRRWALHVDTARALLAVDPKLPTRTLAERMSAALDGENITNNRATEVRRWLREQAKEAKEEATA